MHFLHYNITDISERTDTAKGHYSNECITFLYWLFKYGLKFQDFLCNGCHNLAMLYLNICNIAIITVEGIDYCCILYDTSKSEAIPLLQTFVFNDCECL